MPNEIEHKLHSKRNEGLALITVIAVIAILSIIVLEFSSRTLLDIDISANFRDRTQAQYNAEAGFNFAIKVLRDDDTTCDTLQDSWASPQDIFMGDLIKHYKDTKDEEGKSDVEIAQEEEEKPDPVDYGLGKASIFIVDEERKFNINRLLSSRGGVDDGYRQMLARLLRSLEYPELDVDGLLDSVVDWIDSDDDGPAEKSSYYDFLDSPYEPDNAPIGSLYQLLLVKGMNRLILFGDTPYPLQTTGAETEEELAATAANQPMDSNEEKTPVYGLSSFINTCTRGAININTAPREVLMALFEEQQFLVDDIIKARIEEPLSDAAKIRSLFSMVSPDYYQSKQRYISTRSSYFWVVSVGEYGNARVKLIGLLYRASRNEIKILYQRYENMSTEEPLPFPQKPVVTQEET